MRIAGIGEAFPDHYYNQAAITASLTRVWHGRAVSAARLASLHQNVQVAGRYLAMPLEWYETARTFGETNDAWIDVAVRLGRRAAEAALERAGLKAADVDAIFFSTVTGVCSPSLDARLVNLMGFRPDVKRMPLFGLGCVAGAAAVSRAADYVAHRPDAVALVLTVELCSLTLQRDDCSVANLISTGLFGDGASAAVVTGANRPASGPEIVATRSVFYPDTEDVMGWKVSERGFQIVLSPAVPVFARERVPSDVDALLVDHGLGRDAVAAWVCHPGGPRVLEALEEGLGLDRDQLAASWRTLERYGNLSSASLLLILGETMSRPPAPSSHGIMLAMGPAFCSEILLLRWT